MHLVGFTVEIFRDARPYKSQICEILTFVKLTDSNKKKLKQNIQFIYVKIL